MEANLSSINPVTPALNRPDNVSHDRLLRAEPQSPISMAGDKEIKR